MPPRSRVRNENVKWRFFAESQFSSDFRRALSSSASHLHEHVDILSFFDRDWIDVSYPYDASKVKRQVKTIVRRYGR